MESNRTQPHRERAAWLWPLGALLLVTALAAGAVLWFLNAAVSNEKLAARERLAIAYRGYTEAGKAAIDSSWAQFSDEALGIDLSPAERFAKASQLPSVSSTVIYGSDGKALYPTLVARTESRGEGPRWVAAGVAEFQRKDFASASREYRAIVTDALSEANFDEAELALRAEVRCLVKTGELEQARERFQEGFSVPTAIAVSCGFALFEALHEQSHLETQSLGKKLADWVSNYGNARVDSPQRRLVMTALSQKTTCELPILLVEELAASLLLKERGEIPEIGLLRTDAYELTPFSGSEIPSFSSLTSWWDGKSSCRVLFGEPNLQRHLRGALSTVDLPEGARLVARRAEEAKDDNALVSAPASISMRGWRVDVELEDSAFAQIGQRRIAGYTAGGIAVVIALCGLTSAVGVGMRRHLRRAQIKHDLAATISHELKTPLSSMRLLVDLMLEGGGGDEAKAREYLTMISAENARLSHLVENFLTYARIENGAGDAALQLVQPDEILRAAGEAVQRRYGDRRIEVEVEEGLPPLKSDAGALGTALLNLADNACKYSPEDQPVVLSCDKDDSGETRFVVADRGEGLTEAELARALRSFERLDESAEAPGGCGLGLYIVKRLVERLGGRLEVDSAPGKGSRFSIHLPAVPNESK